jgi:hypothetical protein
VVLVEPDAHAERAARDVAVLAAAVRDERIRWARLGADRIDDVQELHVRVAVRREPLPSDTRLEIDDAAPAGPREEPVVVVQPLADDARRRLRRVAEDVAHRHPELGDERVQGAHRRIDAVELDLGHETRRDADAPRKLSEADAPALALLAQPATDLGGLEAAVCRGHAGLP